MSNLVEKIQQEVTFEKVLSAALKTPAVKNLIWKITFVRRGKDGQVITQQVLFRLVTGMDEGKCIVLSFGFI